MGCFGSSKKSSKRSETLKTRKTLGGTSDQTQLCSDSIKVSPYRDVNKEGVVGKEEDQLALDVKGLNLEDRPTGKKAQTFTFEELKAVAIKQLDRNGAQGIREFAVEVLTLTLIGVV
ncbi:hypothetical protein HID58_075900 [Brassica napus]|uniref:(rape) hypothetical protein n=2 Tax=Brassica TaxID=3705 RepID=A0A816M9M0_BRANA|nr:hypothetical protein HID58_075900 [Brassica napus]CAF1985297.1 unnamed protein product [Brassica napus]